MDDEAKPTPRQTPQAMRAITVREELEALASQLDDGEVADLLGLIAAGIQTAAGLEPGVRNVDIERIGDETIRPMYETIPQSSRAHLVLAHIYELAQRRRFVLTAPVAGD